MEIADNTKWRIHMCGFAGFTGYLDNGSEVLTEHDG